ENPTVSRNDVPPSTSTLDASKLKVKITENPKNVPDTIDSSGLQTTDHMIFAEWRADTGWDIPELVPYSPLSLDPTANVLHYSSGCFEGMRLYRGYDRKLRLLRPAHNCHRMLDSAHRSALPSFDPDELLKLIRVLCATDAPKWLPNPESTLYIRPSLIGTEHGLGYSAAHKALLFIVLAMWPLPTNEKHLHLVTNDKNEVRAWPGGTGSQKLGANYALGLSADQRAKANGADQVLWLFGSNKEVTEAGASNFFVLWREASSGTLQLVTPPLGDLILPGVMRRMVLDLAREVFPRVDIREERFTIDDIILANDQGRLVSAFTTGTASFILPVVSIKHDGREIPINSAECRHITLLKDMILDIVNGRQKSDWVDDIDAWHPHCVSASEQA
ncbi:branched-chain amino acid aminotransferase II, partial [Aspergillus ambiguus]|uniref:branched-chain amino acid aminotransferase II n=1 Tax=Aspergillus ambiguus TaxID=176160 RepID=UPI003CCE0887